ncbi:O-antigen polysaccharide polymerase Wzy [Paraglaciecola arctica]|uniref:O-antigen polysaccharide polymerase Wzy n=1 Tax=Paraglaciecola arctica TaxID=1128911 RepID=UPI00209057DC|nr:O-antigen polysaccharide polymerase Wzy [Paraglaciecola arctica]
MSIRVDNNLVKIFGIWAILLIGAWSFAAYFNVFDAPREKLELLTALNWIVLSFILSVSLPKGIWSISFIFFTALCVFHTGLVLANSVGGITDEDLHYVIRNWFYTRQTNNAIHLVNIALIGYALAVIAFSKPVSLRETEVGTEDFQKRLFHIGGALLTLFVFIFLAIIFSTGMYQSYFAYLTIMSELPLISMLIFYTYLFIGISLVLVSVTYQSGYSIWYFLVFGIFAVIAFKTGLRGEVMFPTAVAGCMLGKKGVPIKTHTLLILLVVFLIATGIVKNARVSGDYSGQGMSVNPLNAVAEMGGSLRPLQEVILWRENGFELLNGTSYWAPFERQLALFIPQLERVDALEDDRLLNVVVQQRVGPIGFSPIAEAYINFGEAGVFFVFFAIGSLMAFLDSRKSTVKSDIIQGVLLVPLFVMVRNAFTQVPVQIVIGWLVVALLFYIAYRKKDSQNMFAENFESR